MAPELLEELEPPEELELLEDPAPLLLELLLEVLLPLELLVDEPLPEELLLDEVLPDELLLEVLLPEAVDVPGYELAPLPPQALKLRAAVRASKDVAHRWCVVTVEPLRQLRIS